MHETPKEVNRRVIPRWRRLQATPRDELEFASARPPAELERELAAASEAWSSNPSLENAAELLYIGSLGLRSNSITNAAHHVLNLSSAPPSIRRMAAKHIQPEIPGRNISLALPNSGRFQIRELRRQTHEYPRNPLAHLELARAYCVNGLLEKANEHIRIALQLAPTSRYVIRSTVRFDVHRGDLDRSYAFLANVAEHDPWIAASLVSVSDISERPIKNIKAIRRLLSEDRHPSQVSELAAALATLEAKNTSVKRARKYIQLCSVSPNENVIAQLYWMARAYGIGFDKKLLNAEAFEASTLFAAEHNSFRSAVEACWRWYEDEPFSVRPAYEGGFIASELLQNPQIAQEFAFKGLQANPKEVGLINNLAFALILEEKFPQAMEQLERAKSLNSDSKKAPILTATEGLLHYRQGRSDVGAKMYIEAMLNAHEQKQDVTKQLAFIHFCYEELRIGHAIPMLTRSELERVFNGPRSNRTIKEVYRHLLVPLLEAVKQVGLPSQHNMRPEALFDLSGGADRRGGSS